MDEQEFSLEELLSKHPVEISRAIDKFLSEQRLIHFIEAFWQFVEPGRQFYSGWAIEAIAEHLEAVTSGEIKRLLINVPPGFMKSLTANVFWPAWEWGPLNSPTERFLSVSYSQSLTIRDNVRFRQVISSDLYKALWGDRFGASKEQYNLIKVGNSKTGWKLAASVSGTVTGERGSRVVCFPYEALVSTPNGEIEIGFIVENKINVPVFSFNCDDDLVEIGNIVSWQINPSRPLVDVVLSDGREITSTHDHRFITTNRGKVRAEDLLPGDELISLDIGMLRNDGLPISDTIPRWDGILRSNQAYSGAEVCAAYDCGTQISEVVTAQQGSRQMERGAGNRHDLGGCEFVGLLERIGSAGHSCLQEFQASRPQHDVGGRWRPGSDGGVGDCQKGKTPRDSYKTRSFGAQSGDPEKSLDTRNVRQACGVGASEMERSRISQKDDGCTTASRREFNQNSEKDVGTAGSAREGSGWIQKSDGEILGRPRKSGEKVETFEGGAQKEKQISETVVVRSVILSQRRVGKTYNLTIEGNHNYYINRILVGNCDDPNSVAESESDAILENTKRWFLESLPSRLQDLRTDAIVVIQQRTSERDISGVILENGLNYDHLMIPMQYEPSRHCVTSIGWQDPRGLDEDGNLLNGEDLEKQIDILAFPERFPLKEVRDLAKTMGPYAADGQLQQRPSPRGGGIFKSDWWNSFPPEDWPIPKSRNEPPPQPKYSYICAALDTALTEKEENDYSALTVWGVWHSRENPKIPPRLVEDPNGMLRMTDNDQPKAMLIHAWQKRLHLYGPPEYKPDNMTEAQWNDPLMIAERQRTWGLMEWIIYTCKKYRVDNLLIEDKAAGHTVHQELARLNINQMWSTQLVDPRNQDKVARAYSIQHLFSNGIIYGPQVFDWVEQTWRFPSWCQAIIDEMAAFPKASHDDQTDSCVYALRHLRDIGVLMRRDEAEMAFTEDLTWRGNVRPLYDM